MLTVGSPLLKCLVGPIQKEGLEMGLFCPFCKRIGIESRRPMTWSCLAKEFERSSKPMACWMIVRQLVSGQLRDLRKSVGLGVLLEEWFLR